MILGRADGHGSVANTAALNLGGIDKNTPNPFGEISKDKQSGEPNGMLLDAAQNSSGAAFHQRLRQRRSVQSSSA